MNSLELLRNQIQWAHELLEETALDVTPELLHWNPPGLANPLAAIYAHAILVEDGVIHSILNGERPLFSSAWEGKTGISAPQMHATPEWARNLRVDQPRLKEYASAVFTSTMEYLARLEERDLERVIDIGSNAPGRVTLAWVLSRMIAGHLDNMTGEISTLKGLQGVRGYAL